MNILAVRKFLTLKHFDATTEQGRSDERYRLAIWATLTNTLSTALAMLTLILTVPMTLPYLGDERFGIWMTVSSIAVLLSFLDFGIGNGLINRVAQAHLNPDQKELSFIVTHGLGVLTILSTIVAIVIFPLINYLPLENIIKVKNPLNSVEIRTTTNIFLAIFVATIPLAAIQKIFQGLQLAWQANLVRGLGSITSLIVVYIISKKNAGVPELLLATYGIQTAFSLLLLLILIRKKIFKLRILMHRKWYEESKLLLQTGGLFFILQIGGTLIWSVDSIIIATTAGAAYVTKFAIIQRLFQFVIIPLGLVNSPLWAAYANANASGDKNFIAKTLKRSIAGTTLMAILSVVFIATFSSSIIEIWIKNSTDIPKNMVWSYGILILFMSIGNCFAMFLNGVGEIKTQVITTILFIIVAIPLKYLGLINYGVTGLILASTIAYICTILLPYITVLKKNITKYIK